jgi:hypothetical protein
MFIQGTISTLTAEQTQIIAGGAPENQSHVKLEVTGNSPRNFAFNLGNVTVINDQVSLTIEMRGTQKGIQAASVGIVGAYNLF